MSCQSANTNEPVALSSRIDAAIAMKLCARRSELKHLTRDYDPASGLHGAEYVHHCLQSGRIRIVAIVDQSGAGEMQCFATLFPGPYLTESLRNLRHCDTVTNSG